MDSTYLMTLSQSLKGQKTVWKHRTCEDDLESIKLCAP